MKRPVGILYCLGYLFGCMRAANIHDVPAHTRCGINLLAKLARIYGLHLILMTFLIIAIFPIDEDGFYVLLKFVICGGCAFLAVNAREAGRKNMMWFLGGLAVLYNPIVRFSLGREIWMVVDVATIIVLGVNMRMVGRKCNAKANETKVEEKVVDAKHEDLPKRYSFPDPYADINCEAVLEQLSKATSSSEIKNALLCFATERDGYKCCKEWLRGQLGKKFEDRIKALFVAYYFGDKEFCDSVYQEGYVCSPSGATQLFDLFCHNGEDQVVKSFIDRYTNSSEMAKRAYAEKIPWFKYVDSDDNVAYAFYQSLGIKPQFNDDYLTSVHWSGSCGGHPTSSYEGITHLSKAIEQDNLSEIKKLLKWGVDPNQYLYRSYSYPWRRVGVLSLEPEPRRRREPNVFVTSHIISLIKSREAFDALVAAGMDRKPPRSICIVDGVRKPSEEKVSCRFS